MSTKLDEVRRTAANRDLISFCTRRGWEIDQAFCRVSSSKFLENVDLTHYLAQRLTSLKQIIQNIIYDIHNVLQCITVFNIVCDES